MKFELDTDEVEKLNEWMKTRPEVTLEQLGAIGGRYVFTFCYTSLGRVATVRDEIIGDELDLTDYSSW
jgi:hypothetical protein